MEEAKTRKTQQAGKSWDIFLTAQWRNTHQTAPSSFHWPNPSSGAIAADGLPPNVEEKKIRGLNDQAGSKFTATSYPTIPTKTLPDEVDKVEKKDRASGHRKCVRSRR